MAGVKSKHQFYFCFDRMENIQPSFRLKERSLENQERLEKGWNKERNKVTKTIIFQKKEEPWNQIEARRERKGERAEFISAVIVSVR